MFQFLAVKAKKKEARKFIKIKRGKSYKEELRTQEDEFMLYSLK